MGTDPRSGFSSHLIRCDDFEGEPCFFVGSELSLETKLYSVIDALYMLQLDDAERTSFEFGLMYGGHAEQQLLIQILANINELVSDRVRMKVYIDFELIELPTPFDFQELPGDMESRLALIDRNREPPGIIEELKTTFENPSLEWSCTSLSEDWIGRIDGVQFCKTTSEGACLLSLDENPRARRIILEQLSQHGIDLDVSTNRTLTKDEAVSIISILQSDESVSRLQECVSPQRVRARVVNKKAKLIPGEAICEDFPCAWSSDPVSFRTADLLIHDSDHTYAVNFEISTGGRIQNNYRYGILKAALNAQFLRSAQKLVPWLQKQKISSDSFQPVLAFPKLTSARARSRFPQLTALAELFSVQIVQVRGSSL